MCYSAISGGRMLVLRERLYQISIIRRWNHKLQLGSTGTDVIFISLWWMAASLFTVMALRLQNWLNCC